MRRSPWFFVVSGGPGAGKTTLLQELAQSGVAYAPEVARQVIEEQMREGGTALPWGDREAYTDLMLRRSVESYQHHASGPMPAFSDRGIPDTLAYARLIGRADTSAIENACREYRYAPLVFITPPWAEIYCTDDQRRQDWEEAQRTFTVLSEVYRQCGYRLLEVPRQPADQRAKFVLMSERSSTRIGHVAENHGGNTCIEVTHHGGAETLPVAVVFSNPAVLALA
jgi:predicted ATPase